VRKVEAKPNWTFVSFWYGMPKRGKIYRIYCNGRTLVEVEIEVEVKKVEANPNLDVPEPILRPRAATPALSAPAYNTTSSLVRLYNKNYFLPIH
jgi:hypothetical protein